MADRGPTPVPGEHWDTAMTRLLRVLNLARAQINLVKMYGNPSDVYSYPASAIPPVDLSNQAPIRLAKRDPVTGESMSSAASKGLAKRTDGDVLPPLARSALCRS